MEKKVKLLLNKGFQTIRLPQEFYFEGGEVYIRRDPDSGDVILSQKPTTWDSFFKSPQEDQNTKELPFRERS